jgi:hypothetical protein
MEQQKFLHRKSLYLFERIRPETPENTSSDSKQFELWKGGGGGRPDSTAGLVENTRISFLSNTM